MKTLLLDRYNNYDFTQSLPSHSLELVQDLGLNTLWEMMAKGDARVFEMSKSVMLNSMPIAKDTVLYRQDILRDCLKNPWLIRSLYQLSCEAIEKEKHEFWGIFNKYPTSVLHHARQVLQLFTGILGKMRAMADAHVGECHSEGLHRLWHMFQTELSDEYLQGIDRHLADLKLSEGVLMSYGLGRGNKGDKLVLNKFAIRAQGRLRRLLENYVHRQTVACDGHPSGWMKLIAARPKGYTFVVSSRDEGGIRALGAMKDEGVNVVANALAQSADHILGFFRALQSELAFYVGCMNLYEWLAEQQLPLCFPEPVEDQGQTLSMHGMYDVCLAQILTHPMVLNDLEADEKRLCVITGANQGGKSTFLRSIALAQFMMHSGMFVPASDFRASLCTALFTHYKREEDEWLRSGKFDEELQRMNEIITKMKPGAQIFFNESFAATNEREGAEIAGQIVKALVERGIKVFFVTHMYEFAAECARWQWPCTLFLRADRQDDTQRTFKIRPGEALRTSYGLDLYRQIFKGISDEIPDAEPVAMIQ